MGEDVGEGSGRADDEEVDDDEEEEEEEEELEGGMKGALGRRVVGTGWQVGRNRGWKFLLMMRSLENGACAEAANHGSASS
jgi:hypothetical protein